MVKLALMSMSVNPDITAIATVLAPIQSVVTRVHAKMDSREMDISVLMSMSARSVTIAIPKPLVTTVSALSTVLASLASVETVFRAVISMNVTVFTQTIVTHKPSATIRSVPFPAHANLVSLVRV